MKWRYLQNIREQRGLIFWEVKTYLTYYQPNIPTYKHIVYKVIFSNITMNMQNIIKQPNKRGTKSSTEYREHRQF